MGSAVSVSIQETLLKGGLDELDKPIDGDDEDIDSIDAARAKVCRLRSLIKRAMISAGEYQPNIPPEMSNAGDYHTQITLREGREALINYLPRRSRQEHQLLTSARWQYLQAAPALSTLQKMHLLGVTAMRMAGQRDKQRQALRHFERAGLHANQLQFKVARRLVATPFMKSDTLETRRRRENAKQRLVAEEKLKPDTYPENCIPEGNFLHVISNMKEVDFDNTDLRWLVAKYKHKAPRKRNTAWDSNDVLDAVNYQNFCDDVFKKVRQLLPPPIGTGRAEVIMTGPFDRKHKGVRPIAMGSMPKPMPDRMRYRFCKTAVSRPSSLTRGQVAQSAQLPSNALQLEWVYGYGGNVLDQNLYYLGDKNQSLLYCSAAVVVVYDPKEHTQKHFLGHTDDVTCLDVHPNGRFVLSGQCGKDKPAGSGDPRHADPHIVIWDSKTMQMLGVVGYVEQAETPINPEVDFSSSIPSMKLRNFYHWHITAASFAGQNGQYIVACGADERHTLGVWDWKTGTLLAQSPTVKMSPPKLMTLVGNTYMEGLDGAVQFVSGGERHLKFWFYTPEPEMNMPNVDPDGLKASASGLRSVRALYKGEPVPKLTTCALFWRTAGLSFTGGKNGRVYVWRAANTSGVGSFDGKQYTREAQECVFSFQAHDKGGVWSLASDTEGRLYTGGGDGVVSMWAVSTTELRVAKHFDYEVYKHTEFDSESYRSVYMTSSKEITANAALLSYSNSLITAKPSAIRCLAVPRGLQTSPIAVGTARCEVWLLHLNGDAGYGDLPSITTNNPSYFESMHATLTEVTRGHSGDVWGLCAHPTMTDVFASVGADSKLRMWDARQRCVLRHCTLESMARCIDISPDGKTIAVGFYNSSVILYDAKLEKIPPNHLRRGIKKGVAGSVQEPISVVKFSPDSTMLAVGGHDNYIDIYKDRNNQANASFRFAKRLMGHASYITALDWSLDGRLLQSTDGGYELLYWDVKQGKLAQSKHAKPFGDVRWLTRTCTLGFDVMGIWPDASDGTDINSLATSTPGFNASNLLAATSAIFDEDEDGPSEMETNFKHFAVVPNTDRKPSMLVTGDDYGGVKVFNYPCVANDAPFYRLNGHSSHVTSVRFLGDEQRVVTAGGRDHTLLQWKVVPSGDMTWFPDKFGNGYPIKQDQRRNRLRKLL